MMLTLVYAAVFVAVLIAGDSLLRSVFRSSERKSGINERLRKLETSEDFRKTYSEILKERGADGTWQQLPFLQKLRLYYTQSGIKFDPLRFTLYAVGGAIVVWIGLQFLFADMLVRVLAFILICVLTPVIIVWRVRAGRMKKFGQKLPEALDVANRSLAAGHPLSAAISLVAREMPDPIGTEFGLLSDELTYGVTLDQALVNMADRVGVEDLNLLAIALTVQAGTGGNLVEILDNLSKTLRERAMLRAKVRSITSEGRITAIFMSIYPFGLYAMIKAIAPTYFDPVWNSGYGPTVLTGVAVVMIIGNIILYKMVNFEF